MIKMDEVFKVYDNGTRALKGVSFDISDGEFAFLVGPSGSGKTSVIKMITGEERATEGTVSVNGY
ncbi:MAG: ATP-binding cassette domain-containing protein, partial [Sporomusa sp.]